MERLKRIWVGITTFLHNVFMSRPPASTFKEGQRALMVKLMSAAGMFCGILSIILVYIIWRGGWQEALQGQQLSILGWGLAGCIIGMLIVIIALTIGGPVGRTSLKVSKDGAEVTTEGDGD